MNWHIAKEDKKTCINVWDCLWWENITLWRKRFTVHANSNLHKRHVNETIVYAKFLYLLYKFWFIYFRIFSEIPPIPVNYYPTPSVFSPLSAGGKKISMLTKREDLQFLRFFRSWFFHWGWWAENFLKVIFNCLSNTK